MKRFRTSSVVLAALVLGALAGCEGDGTPERVETPSSPDQEIDNFTLTHTRQGDRVWVLEADHARIYEEADRVETSDVRVDFHGEDGELQSTLTADAGILLRRTNDIEAIGRVVVTAEDGTVLRTDRLAWNERVGRISTESPVEIIKDDDVMTGVGMESNPDLTNIRVKSEFRAYVRTPEGELVEER